MISDALIDHLLALSPGPEQQRWLVQHAAQIDDQVAQALKERSDRLLRSNVQAALAAAAALAALAEVTGNPRHKALSLLAQANALAIGLGQHQPALALYEAAAALYGAQGAVVEQARAQVGKVWPLAALGRYDEALATGAWATEVLRREGRWLALAKLTTNLAAIHGRLGQDSRALALLDEAQAIYRQRGEEGRPFLGRVEHNRAIVLRTLGRFDESMAASRQAQALLAQTGQPIGAARAQQNLAVTYFVLGRYNEALAMLDEVRETFRADGRMRDAVLVDLFVSDCLLQLRRFAEVIEKCRQARALFAQLETRFEMAQAWLNEAVAYAGMERFAEAQQALAAARAIFVAEGNPVWVALVDLEQADLLGRSGQWAESLRQAAACSAAFRTHDLPVEEARACLAAGRAAAALDQRAAAHTRLAQALAIGRDRDLPTLTYQSYHLSGKLAQQQGDQEGALAHFTLAIDQLERLRSRMMIEHRVDFLEDKEEVYADAVDLCLDLGQAQRGLELAERAKSRALLDLLAGRLDISLQARRPADQPLVDELLRLRAERDRLYRRWQSPEGWQARERGWAAADADWQQAQQAAAAIEKQITEIWHRLLVRNADYARDATLWQVRSEPVQPFLADDTALLEYFVVHGRVVVFVVTAQHVTALRLPVDVAQVQQQLRLLWLNLQAVPRASSDQQLAGLTANAQGLLRRLYQGLLAPAAAELAPFARWVVVPHGPLHYLPFHALHDGAAYVIQGREISYLPGASFLRFSDVAASAAEAVLAVGHSYGGLLPGACREAELVAALLGGQAVVEDDARVDVLRAGAGRYRVLHLAAHGDFRPDNPLFSGLALADGWLTTLDIFGLRLAASLVTLSACQTGRNVVAGGDELLGLMRAFLSVGAASLVLSLWPVEDRSTAALMVSFYRKLAVGLPKGQALAATQQEFIAGQAVFDGAPLATTHPYYWAPFFLVGATGPL